MKPSDFVYCLNCNMEIPPTKVIKRVDKITTSTCTNPLEGYLDDYKYEDTDEFYNVTLCPCCNKILKKDYIGTTYNPQDKK